MSDKLDAVALNDDIKPFCDSRYKNTRLAARSQSTAIPFFLLRAHSYENLKTKGRRLVHFSRLYHQLTRHLEIKVLLFNSFLLQRSRYGKSGELPSSFVKFD